MKYYCKVIILICFFVILIGLWVYINSDSRSVTGQRNALDLIYKNVLSVIKKDRDSYLECFYTKDRLFAEKSYELECLHREFIQNLLDVYGANAWEQYKEIKVGRSWIWQSSFELLENEDDTVKFVQETSVYFSSNEKALWDPPVGVVALKKKGDNWFINPKETCDIKRTIDLFQKNIGFYKQIIPLVRPSSCSLEELKLKIIDIYFDDIRVNERLSGG